MEDERVVLHARVVGGRSIVVWTCISVHILFLFLLRCVDILRRSHLLGSFPLGGGCVRILLDWRGDFVFTLLECCQIDCGLVFVILGLG